MKELFDFNNDPLGVKAVIVMMGLIFIGMVVWESLGLDSGIGGTPFGDY